MKRKTEILVFAAVLFLGIFLRIYRLGEIPYGLSQDETSLGYNSYSILKTYKDEYGKFLPQNFKAFGEYKLPGYIYSSIIPISLFGLTPFSIRLTSAISGIIQIILIYLITKLLLQFTESKNLPKIKLLKFYPLLTALLATINPWSLHYSRAAFEVNLANFFVLFGVYLFLKSIISNKAQLIYLSIILFSLSLYTYNMQNYLLLCFSFS
ncbi:hypothetical protein ACFL1A_00035 [Patescibacteria group bacterium]